MTWDLHLASCQSLKDKRRILKSLKDRMHNEFNVSVAETDQHDKWQRAELTCCVVGNDRRHVESVLENATSTLERHPLVRVIDSTKQVL